LKDVETTALIDCGAQGRFIDESVIGKNKVRRLGRPITVRNVDSTRNLAGRITHETRVKYWIGKQEFDDWFYITSLGDQRIIFGMPWLKDNNPDIDWKEGIVKFIDWSLDKDRPL